jgi:hypothetical protein
MSFTTITVPALPQIYGIAPTDILFVETDEGPRHIVGSDLKQSIAGLQMNTEVLTESKYIPIDGPTVQLLYPNGADREVFVPEDPEKTTEFVIINGAPDDSPYVLLVKVAGMPENLRARVPGGQHVRMVYNMSSQWWLAYDQGPVGVVDTHTHTPEHIGAEVAGAVAAHELAHPAPTTRDDRNQVAGSYEVGGAVAAHELAHPVPSERDTRNEVAGAAASAVSAHELNHPAPTTRDDRNEVAGAAAGAVAAHELAHPAPTERDTRNAAAGAGDAGDAHAAIVTGNPHNTTAANVGAEVAGAVAAHELAHPAPTTRDDRNQVAGSYEVGGAVAAHELNHPAPTTRDDRNQVAGSYEVGGAVAAHELNHPAPTTRDDRNEVAGAAASAVSAHELAHPAPTARDDRNEVAGAAASAVSAHELAHPVPSERDTRNEAAGTAASSMTAHTTTHPAPTNRDTRNAAAGAGDAGDAHAAIVTGNPHGTTAAEVGAVATSGNETIAGTKTFSSYPLLPEAAPTGDREAVPKDYLGTSATLDVGTAADNIVQLDGDAKLPAVDGSQLTNLPSGGGGVEVNTETLSADKTIADGDPSIQLLTPNGANRNVLLPATPAKDCEFVIVNAGAHTITHYLEVKLSGDSNYFTRLYAHATARVCFDSTSGLWTCYGPGWHRTRTGANTYVGGEATEIGHNADGSSLGAAVGYYANGSSYGAAVGRNSNGSNYGAAVGNGAGGSNMGAAVGTIANGSSSGAAVGRSSNGSSEGAAIGYMTNGSSQGAAVGRSSNGSNNGAAMGRDALCNSKQFGSAIANASQQQRYGGHARSGDHLTTNKQSVEEVQWKGQTTNATATEIFLHGVSANRCTVLASSAIMFNGTAVAKQAATGDTKAWTFQGCIKRDAANNTVLVGAVTSTVIAEDAGASAWVLTIEADDTNEAIKVTVTGEESHTIDWGVEARLLDRLN